MESGANQSADSRKILVLDESDLDRMVGKGGHLLLVGASSSSKSIASTLGSLSLDEEAQWAGTWASIADRLEPFAGSEVLGNAWEYVVRPSLEAVTAIETCSRPMLVGPDSPPTTRETIYLARSNELPVGARWALARARGRLIRDLRRDLELVDVPKRRGLLELPWASDSAQLAMSAVGVARGFLGGMVFTSPMAEAMPVRLAVARTRPQARNAGELVRSGRITHVIWLPQMAQGAMRPPMDLLAGLRPVSRNVLPLPALRTGSPRPSGGESPLERCAHRAVNGARSMFGPRAVADAVLRSANELGAKEVVTYEHFGPFAVAFKRVLSALPVRHTGIELANPPLRPIPGFPPTDEWFTLHPSAARARRKLVPADTRLGVLRSSGPTEGRGDAIVVFTQPYEFDRMAQIVLAVDDWRRRYGCEMVVKLHPRDRLEHYPAGAAGVMARHLTDADAEQLLRTGAAVAISRTSSVLGEAIRLGVSTISVQLSDFDATHPAWYLDELKSRGSVAYDSEALALALDTIWGSRSYEATE